MHAARSVTYFRSGAARAKLVLLAGLTVLSAHGQVVYKCVSGRSTTFQERPCDSTERQSVIPSAPAAEVAIPTTPPSDQQRLDGLEAERLRKEAEFAVRDKAAQLASQVGVCERVHGVVFSRGNDRSLTGATYPQTQSADSNARAARCIARANDLQQQLARLRGDCIARGCKESGGP